ncbi:MAG: DUF1566 domain-containing protein [Planctomycetes bacterium]|nr:DUF1566 domain-containing protein [Planctomycetota bacterium]
MKKVALTTIAVALALTTLMAQVPQSINYQGVARDNTGAILATQGIALQISILSGSPTGTVEYSETHTTTTNQFGLFTLQIGNGTVVSGDFTTINWGANTHYAKVEMDETGGANYQLMGTSQLLSVPYALHAKTAETVTETDPVFGSSLASGITAADTANWNNHTIDTDTQLDSTGVASLGYVAGAHTDSTAVANMGFVAGSGVSYAVGDFAQGGIVFWVDETGQHGLVCAKTDQSISMRWHAGTDGNTRAYGDGPYSGEMNTSIIISRHGSIGDDGATYAARVCAELQVTEGGKTYGDWYLPSKQELNLMYQNKAAIDATATANGGVAFATNYYWSSTEFDFSLAWIQHFNNGGQYNGFKNVTSYVRSVRAF